MFQYSIIKWVYNLRILPRWVIIIIDLVFIAFSTALGYLLRFNFEVEDISSDMFFSGVSLSIVCGFVSIFVSGSYRGIVRYTGLQDGVRIFYMLVLNSLFLCGLNLLYSNSGHGNLIPYSVVLISYLASFLFLFNYRLLINKIRY